MQASFLILSATLILWLMVFPIADIISGLLNPHINLLDISFIPHYVSIVIGICSIGSFEANALQFGMDQLLEVSSTQLSAFIHWYFWVMHLGQQLVFCVLLVILLLLYSILNGQISTSEEDLITTTITILLFLIWLIGLLLASYFFHYERKHLYVAKVGINPFKNM